MFMDAHRLSHRGHRILLVVPMPAFLNATTINYFFTAKKPQICSDMTKCVI